MSGPVAVLVPPGQLIVYWPGLRLRSNFPDRPATRFSFSPRIRSPSRISNSETFDVPALEIWNVVGPAPTFSSAGSQPASVSSTATVLAPAGAPFSAEDPQLATKNTSTSSSDT